MTAGIAARLYARTAAEARSVRLAWHGDMLEIAPQDGTPWLVPGAALAFEARGFNDQQLAIRWSDADGRRLLMLDATAAAVFTDGVPTLLHERLARVRNVPRRTARRFRFGLAGLALIMLLPVAAVIAFVFDGDALVDAVVRRIPAGIEQKLGAAALASTTASTRMITAGPAYEAVQAIGRRLARPDEHLRFYLADDARINAYAAPGGVVVVQSGLVAAAQAPEEVAGVLAHEIAHVELRHGLRQIVKSAGLQALVSLVIGDWGVLGDAGTQLATLKFSRDAEREADARALDRLHAARVDARGLVRFLDGLNRRAGDATPPALLSTHPPTPERLAALAADLNTKGRGTPQAIGVDWEAVRAQVSVATRPATDAVPAPSPGPAPAP